MNDFMLSKKPHSCLPLDFLKLVRDGSTVQDEAFEDMMSLMWSQVDCLTSPQLNRWNFQQVRVANRLASY